MIESTWYDEGILGAKIGVQQGTFHIQIIFGRGIIGIWKRILQRYQI